MTEYSYSFARLLVLVVLGVDLYGCTTIDSKPSEPSQSTGASPGYTQTRSATISSAGPVTAPERVEKPICAEVPAKPTKATKSAKSGSKGKTAANVEPARNADCILASSRPSTPQPVAEPRPMTAGGYDLSKNKPVMDSSKVESGQGTTVKGINDWEGEITGVPFPGAKFGKLKIGMSYAEATDLVGGATDEGAYATGKAFIPFYFGSDRARWEAVYKGHGRLIFSLQSGFGTGRYLTWIIYNPNERGYR